MKNAGYELQTSLTSLIRKFPYIVIEKSSRIDLSVFQVHLFFYEQNRHFLKGFLKNQNLLNVYKKPTLLLKQGFSTPPLPYLIFLFFKKAKYKKPLLPLKKIKTLLRFQSLILGVRKRIFLMVLINKIWMWWFYQLKSQIRQKVVP